MKLCNNSEEMKQCLLQFRGFPGGAVIKNLPFNTGDAGNVDLISGLGRSPGEGNGYPLSILAWRTPWTEKPGGLQSMGSQRVRHD